MIPLYSLVKTRAWQGSFNERKTEWMDSALMFDEISDWRLMNDE